MTINSWDNGDISLVHIDNHMYIYIYIHTYVYLFIWIIMMITTYHFTNGSTQRVAIPASRHLQEAPSCACWCGMLAATLATFFDVKSLASFLNIGVLLSRGGRGGSRTVSMGNPWEILGNWHTLWWPTCETHLHHLNVPLTFW